MLYLGIDQHRKHLTLNLRNEAGEAVLRRQVSTQWTRVRAFLKTRYLFPRAGVWPKTRIRSILPRVRGQSSFV